MEKIEYKAPEMDIIKLKAFGSLLTVSGDGNADIPVDDD